MDQQAIDRMNTRPPKLLTQNRNLRRHGIFNWCLPAWAGRLADGRTYNTCVSAGICRQVCYARAGSYRFSNVLERHQRNLAYLLDDLPGWEAQMIGEIQAKRSEIIVRIHDSGDFFSADYLMAWRRVMDACKWHARFYAYTKEVSLFRALIEPDPPPNFKWVYSWGGAEDHLLADSGGTFRHPSFNGVVDVFPDNDALEAAGHHSQQSNDLLAVDGPAPVGIPANNIPHFKKKQGDRTFRTWQAADDAARAERRARLDALNLDTIIERLLIKGDA